jgi:hypothetical protein
MRRAAVAGLALAAAAASARAEPGALTIEGGVELDSNVQRLESGPRLTARPIPAAVARLGGQLQGARRLGGGQASLTAGLLTRTVTAAGRGDRGALSPESVALASAQLRWLRPIGARPVAIGASALGVDAIPTAADTGSRTFRVLGGDALITLRGGEDRAIAVAVGHRDFTYKPDGRYDWRGPTGSLRLDLQLWQDARGSRALEVSGQLGLEARAYASTALASACPERAPPSPTCYAATSIPRHDRYQRAAVELTWTGRVVAAAAYQLSVIDSNSYGQSIVRHRVTVSTTAGLPLRLFATALATLQIDRYVDGLPVDRDPLTQSFSTLDDENRSSIQGRLARGIATAWSIEARAAIWRNLGGDLDTAFRRGVVYVGAVYSK